MKIPSLTITCIYGHILSLVYSSSVGRAEYGELRLFRAPVSYNVDTTVLLNDVSRKDKEVGYKIKASLDLVPVWSNGESEFLLKFVLVSPQLHSRGTRITSDFVPYKSLWDSHSQSTFYAHWKNGLFEASYLDANDPLDIINYKKSLISLFQFQVIDGELNETDISGTCRVTYETLSMQVIRKIKNECWSPEKREEGEEAPTESRRLTRYTLSSALDALDELYAEELHATGDVQAGVALRARAWQRLTRVASPVSATTSATSLSAALAALPAALTAHSLQLIPVNDSFDDDMELNAVLRAAAASGALRAESAGGGGDAAGARAALSVLPALVMAPRSALDRLLDDERDPDMLAAMCGLLGLAGGATTHDAAVAFLQLHRREPLAALAQRYLAAVGLAPRPQEAVVMDVLALGERGGPLATSALLAAAAAASRATPSAQRTERAVKDALLKGLVKCKEAECEIVRLQALGNLRRADCVEPLLAHAERARHADSALAALDALGALPASAVLAVPGALPRLEALALAPRRAELAGIDVRAAALDLLLTLSAPTPMHLHHTAFSLHPLHGKVEPELRRVFWQRLHELSAQYEHVRTLLRMLPLRIASWHARAVPGTSSVLSREVGTWRGRRARLTSLQLAQHALLRRGRVALQLLDPANSTHEAFAVEVWTRGLTALAGGAGGEEEQEEEAGGGLVLAVGGARLPGITLFQGQGELLGHVWAGRGSEPTPALRALQPLRPRAGAVRLVAGAGLRWRTRAALSYALDAQAQVSLWSRSARSQLEMRAAVVAQCDTRVSGGGATLNGHAELEAEPRLRLAADLDFYDGTALCVRVSLPQHERLLNTTLSSVAGGHRVRRVRHQRHPAAARTLALGTPNDVTCRTLTSADD